MKNSALSLSVAVLCLAFCGASHAQAINGTNPRPQAAAPINGTNPRPQAESPINGTNPRPQATTGIALPGWAEAVLQVLHLG